MNKAQSSLEFTSLLIMLLFIVTVVASILARQAHQDSRARELQILDEIAQVVSEEISLASAVEDGYQRRFSIPQTVLGKVYTIQYVNGFVIVGGQHHEVQTRTAHAIGNVTLGMNTVMRANSSVCINVPQCP